MLQENETNNYYVIVTTKRSLINGVRYKTFRKQTISLLQAIELEKELNDNNFTKSDMSIDKNITFYRKEKGKHEYNITLSYRRFDSVPYTGILVQLSE